MASATLLRDPLAVSFQNLQQWELSLNLRTGSFGALDAPTMSYIGARCTTDDHAIRTEIRAVLREADALVAPLVAFVRHRHCVFLSLNLVACLIIPLIASASYENCSAIPETRRLQTECIDNIGRMIEASEQRRRLMQTHNVFIEVMPGPNSGLLADASPLVKVKVSIH